MPFGSPILDKTDVTERIRRAQLAILNPSQDHERFLEGSWEENAPREISFSSNCVCLHIAGQDLEDLSFVDLPGELFTAHPLYVKITGDSRIVGFIIGGEALDRDLVQKLAEAYISKPSCESYHEE